MKQIVLAALWAFGTAVSTAHAAVISADLPSANYSQSSGYAGSTAQNAFNGGF